MSNFFRFRTRKNIFYNKKPYSARLSDRYANFAHIEYI